MHDERVRRFHYHNPEVDFVNRRPVHEVEDLGTPDLRRIIQSRRHRAEQQRWKEPLRNRPRRPVSPLDFHRTNSDRIAALQRIPKRTRDDATPQSAIIPLMNVDLREPPPDQPNRRPPLLKTPVHQTAAKPSKAQHTLGVNYCIDIWQTPKAACRTYYNV